MRSSGHGGRGQPDQGVLRLRHHQHSRTPGTMVSRLLCHADRRVTCHSNLWSSFCQIKSFFFSSVTFSIYNLTPEFAFVILGFVCCDTVVCVSHNVVVCGFLCHTGLFCRVTQGVSLSRHTGVYVTQICLPSHTKVAYFTTLSLFRFTTLDCFTPQFVCFITLRVYLPITWVCLPVPGGNLPVTYITLGGWFATSHWDFLLQHDGGLSTLSPLGLSAQGGGTADDE